MSFPLVPNRPSYTLYPCPNLTTRVLRYSLAEIAADGRQEGADITGMSFEVVRSSVCGAAQMKASREEMDEAEGEVRVGGREERTCLGSQTHSNTAATVTWKD